MDDYESKASALFKWIHMTTSILYNKVESSEICIRLYLLALQSADESGLEELAYQFAVEGGLSFNPAVPRMSLTCSLNSPHSIHHI